MRGIGCRSAELPGDLVGVAAGHGPQRGPDEVHDAVLAENLIREVSSVMSILVEHVARLNSFT